MEKKHNHRDKLSLSLSKEDDDYVYIELPERSHVMEEAERLTPVTTRHSPLTPDMFSSFLDADGRLMKEHEFRRAVFRGGVEASIRRDVWQFLFCLYPCDSTAREREAQLVDNCARYCAMRDRWRAAPHLHSHDHCEWEVPYKCCHVTGSAELRQKLQFSRVQSRIGVERERMTGEEEVLKAVRIIDKDVPRTDRELDYYSGDDNEHLRVLRTILVTYAAFRPDTTYAQGMNDIASKFLFVFDNEVEAFWAFHNYMRAIEDEFTIEGIENKQGLIRELLKQFDPDLLGHFENIGVGDLTMCHRWLLLGFKREFRYPEVLRCFEILSSRHLELGSVAAQQAQRRVRRTDFEAHEGASRLAEEVETSQDLAFELFMCVGLLLRNCGHYRECRDVADVFSLTNGMAYNLELDAVLQDAERVFFLYCRKTVLDCWQQV